MSQSACKLLVLSLFLAASVSLHVKCSDDEFAEFDDEPIDRSSQPSVAPKDSSKPAENVQDIKLDPSITSDPSSPKQAEPKVDKDSGESGAKKPDLKLVDAPIARQYPLESYTIEFAFIFAIGLFFINFFIGSSKNQNYALQWYAHSRQILKQQFSLVGGTHQISEVKRDDEPEPAPKKQKGLVKVSESLYTLWNSGRVGVDGLLIEISLLKRQDLCSMLLTLVQNSKDNLIMRYLLNNDGYDNFVFCIAHKSCAVKLVREMIDISTFCPKRKLMSQMGFNINKLSIMSELSDVSTSILDSKTVSFLTKYENSINYIHISDQYSAVRSEDASTIEKLKSPRRMATFSFNLPLDNESRSDFINFSLSFLDRLRRFKLSRDGKQKSDKNRLKITEALQKTAFSQRQEAAQAKKEELRRLEKERIYNEDDPEKQKRWEKKEAKREQRKGKMRVKQLKVKSM